MNTSSQSGDRVPVGESDWPRDFDFREAYAEQRELLPAAPAGVTTAPVSTESERND